MKQTAISLTQEQYEALKKRSKTSGCSIASIIRTIITDNFLKEVN